MSCNFGTSNGDNSSSLSAKEKGKISIYNRNNIIVFLNVVENAVKKSEIL